jgi:hypothetical protein
VLKVILVVLLFAALTYGLIRVIERRGIAGRPKGRGQVPRSRPRPRPVAPDDDVDFLRDLDRKKRQPPDPEAPLD